MDSLKELLNINNDIFGIIKAFVAIIGFIAVLLKVREAFSNSHRKRSLKTDLEILEMSKNIQLEKAIQIQHRVESEIDYLYEHEEYVSNNLLNFILGLIITAGFTFWTVSIFQNSEGFNPWTIVTMICAGVGLTLFVERKKGKVTGEFFRIEFHNSKAFKVGFLTAVIASISLVSMILINQKFTWGLFVAGLFAFVGFRAIYKSVKFKGVEMARPSVLAEGIQKTPKEKE